MITVLGKKSWVLWWAALTAGALLRTWLTAAAGLFRDAGIFSPRTVPFSLVAGIDTALAGVADYIRLAVKFDPNAPLLEVGVAVIPNLVVGLGVGVLLLAGASTLYLRSLASERLGDDLLALLVLYFVLRVQAHLLVLSQVSGLAEYGRYLIQNPGFTFLFVVAAVAAAMALNKRLHSVRAFWRGTAEILLLGILLMPREAAGVVAVALEEVAQFGQLLQTNIGWGLLWGGLGLLLALARLATGDVAEKRA